MESWVAASEEEPYRGDFGAHIVKPGCILRPGISRLLEVLGESFPNVPVVDDRRG